MEFANHEEKLKHIGLMCCTNLHDAFSNLSDIMSLCENKEITEKEKIKFIKEKAKNTYELFRVIERYRNQNEKSETKTFLVSDLGKSIGKLFSYEGLQVNLINDFELTCKKTLLVQSLINLIDNAYKHNNNEWKNKMKMTILNFNRFGFLRQTIP